MMYERILALITSEASSAHAIDDAVALAQDQGGDLLLLVVETPSPIWVGEAAFAWPTALPGAAEGLTVAIQREQDALIARARRSGVPTAVIRMQGHDVAALAMEAARLHRCDVIVVGTDGEGVLSRVLFGSPLPTLITASPVPVFVSTPMARRPRHASKGRSRRSLPSAGRASSNLPAPASS